jgi:hypothetical protein
MDTNTLEIAAAVAVAIIVAIAAAIFMRSQSRRRLKSRFGPEYSRAVEESGGAREAEAQLRTRATRVRNYHLKPLDAEEKARFATAWRGIQARFVDDPRDATAGADDLLGQVMSARGYPEDSDFDARLEDLSVDHAQTVQNYRAAHDVVLKHTRGEASTEDLRKAMIDYRALIDDLVGEPAALETAS